MEAIRTNILVNSETITIPQLKKFIGKKVEIICLGEEKTKKSPARLKKFFSLAGKIKMSAKKINELRELSKI
ncbi:MAG TPA: hypothetical protein PK467_00975 [Candidatus Wallbacteria bacterium]|nr:hypothetical protein [Candidatus Wallbacteria bacterium]